MGAFAALRALVVCCIIASAGAIPLLGGPLGNLTNSIHRRELRSKKSKTPAVSAKRKLAGCSSGNPIDSCWMCDPDWMSHRQRLADCAIGFGHQAAGGRSGEIYTVTDAGNDDPEEPKYGTLRWGVIQSKPLWIIFKQDMTIQLKEELIVTSFKTLDGRGANVHIANGACITIQGVTNVIVHGLHIHDCKSTGPARIRSSESHIGDRGKTDGDAISIFESTDIWIDHNSFSNCADGLVDVIQGSDAVTISNNEFKDHDKVMLLGAHDSDYRDKNMKATVCFNKFGPGLIQRMPRCRLGNFHIFNNYYISWEMYAIGGSGQPTINSEGNYFDAGGVKEVTKHLEDGGDYRSNGDIFLNGAYFTPSGASTSSPLYARARSYSALPASQVPRIVSAGPTS
ncbi:pectate lyase [Marchantia polymorpha subsp. ruderalis]|uniref:Pectate lyase n=2 Tax=Marchantia polymorpha TaxID=3197 RepID=A0A176WT29_MARPO|nr:hypothetical protein AXG93_1154s1580 [Marchantia polymorpha subsp. ruderalis]PTQ47658.1 hypothetical protein MARPO_0007s0096 [Marchantia polymorpha]BBN03969.1 hypothetical protein Mp_3g01000 [Marchantia polymorpha subsp. ruderalis]|eukprot:PTQ47658.1 hypothetical protein MARPO_0007s0096 [Marchantia polymorpha]